MKFGKLYDIAGIDFTLPEDPPQTTRVLAKYKDPAKKPQIYLGATGWGNREWVGKWYPSKTKQNEYLRHYSRQFGTIEFNTTHYRIPDAATVDRWYALSQPNFRFSPKLPQQISHYQRLQSSGATTDAFLESIYGLKEKLGPVFMQLPENFSPSSHRSLDDYIRLWPGDLPLGLELRHPEYFKGQAEAEKAFATLEDTGHGTVITDVSGRRDVLHMRLSNPILILRFVGNGLHPTDYPRAQAWAQRLKSWLDQGLQQAYLFIHQPEMEMVPDYTIYWAEAIKEATGIDVLRPQPVPEARQGSLF